MVTITEVVQFMIRQAADQIYLFKATARKTKKSTKIVYVSPDGNTTDLRTAGFTPTKIECDVVTEAMSPKHPTWGAYQGFKRQASLLLTARILLKLSDDSVPDSEQVNLLLGPQSLRPYTPNAQRIFCHAGEHQKSHVRAAHRYLRKLNNRLQNHPERFEKVEAWKEEKRAHQTA